MKPFIREYTNDEILEKDIQILKNNHVDEKDIYILSHDDDRTNRIVKNAGASVIGMNEMKMGEGVKSKFMKKGDELRTKLQEIGFSEAEAQNYESDLDEGKVLLIVTNHDNPEKYLI